MSESTEFSKDVAKFVGDSMLDLPAVNDDGRRCVVAMLGSEPVSELFARLKLAGGYATVFVKMASGSVRILPFMKEECALADTTSLEDLQIPCDAASSVEMLVEAIEQCEGGLLLRVGPASAPRSVRAYSQRPKQYA